MYKKKYAKTVKKILIYIHELYRARGQFQHEWLQLRPLENSKSVQCYSASRRGITGRIKFPKAESWVMKYPVECACACCRENRNY